MTKLRKIFELFSGLAEELSDQRAYKRHLESTGRPHSRAEWRSFIDRRLKKKYLNAKCC